MLSTLPSIQEKLQCPRCRGAVALDGAPTCAQCGQAYPWAGQVLNFFGDSAFALPGKNDVEAASWLVEHHQALSEMFAKNPGPLSRKDVETLCAPLTRGSSLKPQDMVDLVYSGEIHQILSDLERMETGVAEESEIVRFMLDHANIDTDSVVLDIGCSCGRHLWEIAARRPAQIAGLDVHLLALAAGARMWEARQNKPEPQFCCGSATDLPFQDATFSHVYCLGTLSLVPIVRGLREISRVLQPGGRAIITLEGPGLWRKYWENAREMGFWRPNLLRWWLGNKLMQAGVDWQRFGWSRRLAGFTQYMPKTIARLVGKVGLQVDKCDVIRTYKDIPSVVGVVATKV